MNHTVDPQLADFRNFLFIVWKHLNLPDPTPIQYDIAEYLQNGPHRSVIEAFRGVGKSWVTSAFVCWNLLMNPQMNILVVSASKTRADDFSTFCQRLIAEMDELAHLRPKSGQRNSKIAFDVGPARASHAPSVKSVGITGQLAGSRADLIVADDVEVPGNSMTEGMRIKLSEAVKEFDAVLKPGGRIVYLGTPQTEMSLYNKLPERGYEIQIWPARYPDEDRRERYGGKLARFIAFQLDANPNIVGKTTEPYRFSDMDLLEREASYGRSGFALQFMLDTQLSDLERYPLKLHDLIIMDLDTDMAPEKVIWSSSAQYIINDLPNVGLQGDRYYAPMATQGQYVPYTGSCLYIDPAGRGKDETAYAVVKVLNSQLFLLEAGGYIGGYDDETLAGLCSVALRHKVNIVLVESNFGDGMFSKLLQPMMAKKHPVSFEEVRSTTAKEARIVETLEPVMNQHRLIVNKSVIQNDFKTTEKYREAERQNYMLMYQMSRLTKDKGCLAHDDRIEAVAGAVKYWLDAMSKDIELSMKSAEDERWEQELRNFTESIYSPVSDSSFNIIDKRRDTWM